MNSLIYPITAGDYTHGGQASRSLKEHLKRIGASPRDIRRAVIAAYEAEMNVVIHSCGGRLIAEFDDHHLDIRVIDDGPGIADISLAMTEGYSTAPEVAREMGFGAGMGLPNIKRSSDHFHIESAVGQGTTLHFAINLSAHEARVRPANSLHVVAGACRQCLACLRACPVRAMRLRGGGPAALEHLCIDCTSCIAACESQALGVAGSVESIAACRGRPLVVPPAMLAQFGPRHRPADVLRVIGSLGVSEVIVLQAAEDALRKAVGEYARHKSLSGPIIAPSCPAVLNLIQARFPSLIPNVAPWFSALEATAGAIAGRDPVFVVLCPAQRTLLGQRGSLLDSIVPAVLRAAVDPLLAAQPPRCENAAHHRESPHEVEIGEGELLRVTGITHVMRILEAAENGRMNDVSVIEPYACDEGCFGSPLLYEDPFAARRRWLDAGVPSGAAGAAVRRPDILAAMSGVKLDENMNNAIVKLVTIDKIAKRLPGKDCGLCGCPTCASLAEDAVLGRASVSDCRYVREDGRP